MSAALFQIGRSGATASRAALEVTAQNIANAANPDFARRNLQTRELVGQRPGDRGVPNGVLIEGIGRIDSAVALAQARSSASALSSADAELSGLRATELALEQSRVFEGLVEFEAALTQLEGSPLDPALRTSALESARQLAATFQVADQSLGSARARVQETVGIGLSEVNRQTEELARINRSLVTARPGTNGQAALLDSRDAALRAISQEIGIETQFAENGQVSVRIANGSGTGPLLVNVGSSETLAASFQANGTVEFNVGTAAVTPASGSLAGQAAALDAQADYQTQLDGLAADLIARTNAAQASGADADGAGGQPFFSGSNASDIALSLTSGSQIATAPASSPAGSSNTTNLTALIASLGADGGPVKTSDAMLLSLSSRIAGQDVTRGGLAAIAASAEATLQLETGVDLDTEAANLVRLQQAFEANSRVLQVASDLFDTVLAIR